MSDDVDTDQGEPTAAAAAQSTERAPIRLRCLAGGAFPDELRQDAERVSKLTDRALEDLGRVLKPCVLLPVTRELGEGLSRFSLQHEIAEADLGHVLKVCRWLLHGAAALDLSVAELGEDLKAIWGERSSIGKTLQQEYESLKGALREQLLNDALVKHGNVLVDVDWRLDSIASERQAAKLGAAVALVTLAYRDAERSGRLTLQITPDKLARLGEIFTGLAQRMGLSDR